MKRCVFVCAVAIVATADTSFAQAKEPIGWFVLDLRAASVGLPAVAGWTPVVPENTQVPARALGAEAGAHVYLLRLPGITFGLGATLLTGRSTSSPPPPGGTPQTIPEVTTKLRSIVPQVSMNFGHSMGWSYLSVGLGRTRVESQATLSAGTITFIPRDSGWIKTLNYGGGARWFINDHLGVGFDLRWHKLSIVSATATRPGAPRASLLTAAAGLVLK